MKKIYIDCIAGKLGVKDWQVENCVRLFEEGSTIPFISRYRKEKTGGLGDMDLVKGQDTPVAGYLRSELGISYL